MTHAVITGLGVVSPFGCGRERFVAGLAAGQPILSEVDTSAGYHLNRGARLVAATDDRELGEWVPARLARRMSLPSRHAVGAARMALVDAGLDPKEKLGPRAIVSMATAYGMPGVTEELLHDILDDPTTASPFAFPESVANAPAAQIAIMSGAGGLNLTFTERAAGPLLALGRAAREIRRGRADIALAGAFDETHPLLHACLDRLGALARERRGHPERPRPFAEDRDGFVLGGGATVLVVETEERARQRDANVLARVVASGGGFDPSAPAWDWGTGADVLGNRLRAFLDRHDVVVVRSVASASGSR
ncbi:MAG: beta-ketoacyl synthase N-terminal-like domain-containing protein, partial [Acidobacteriota bacterium]